MKACVVDAGVVAKLFFEEEHSDRSVALFRRRPHLLAPDLLRAELAGLAWKRICRRGITDAQAAPILSEAIRRTVYDCLYPALAIRNGCSFVTGDRRLVNALAGGSLERRIRWIGGRR